MAGVWVKVKINLKESKYRILFRQTDLETNSTSIMFLRKFTLMWINWLCASLEEKNQSGNSLYS